MGVMALQEKNGIVGSVVEIIVDLPIQIIEELVMSGKTKDAIKQIQGLADNGDSDAAYYLAKLYQEGDVVKENFKTSAKYLQMAADLGNTKAMMEIAQYGYMCAKSEFDREEVFDWFHKAALSGNSEAEMIISYLYLMGYGCEENKILADMWHLKARIDDFDETKVFEILGKHNFNNENGIDYE
jgi:TPR repeat protein